MSEHWGKKLVTDSHELIDAAKYLRDFALAAEQSAVNGIKIHSTVPMQSFLLQSDRCRRFELVISQLVASAIARSIGGNIGIELMHEADFVHCEVSNYGSEGSSAVPGLECAHQLAKALRGRIGHWFDRETTSLVLTVPLTERERQANRVLRAD